MEAAMSTGSRAPRTASIRDVARVAGVSHQTVSRVLNHHPNISPATRARVQAAMVELQYRPSAAARALSTSRTKTIGVLASGRAHYGPALSIQAIEEAARERGFSVTSSSVAEPDEESLRAAVANLIDQDIEALVVIAPQQRVFDTVADLAPSIPCITMRAAGTGDASALRVDEIAGARLATRHLLELGHTRIGHLAGPPGWVEAEGRMQGCVEELRDHGLALSATAQGEWNADFGYAAGTRLLQQRDVTGYFCSNDAIAMGLLHAARDLGLDVPGDVSIVGYDDVPEAFHTWPPLTTVRQDFAEMGRRCIAILLGTEHPPERVLPQLVVRASTAPPHG
jgi:DNA-binding LacI/PurR family transcriptional regulator